MALASLVDADRNWQQARKANEHPRNGSREKVQRTSRHWYWERIPGNGTNPSPDQARKQSRKWDGKLGILSSSAHSTQSAMKIAFIQKNLQSVIFNQLVFSLHLIASIIIASVFHHSLVQVKLSLLAVVPAPEIVANYKRK